MNYKDIEKIPYKLTGIYKITNKINSKCYIGQSFDIKTRLKNHIKNINNRNNKTYNYPLYKAIRKYGIENFDFEILKILKGEKINKENLNELEIYYISFFNSYDNGYNQTLGGERIGEKSNSTIYTEEIVYQIRTMYKEGKTLKEVKEKFKNIINENSIKSIYEGRQWKYIMPEIYENEEIKKLHSDANNIQHEKISKGENNKFSVLTNENVKEIIFLLEENKIAINEIANKFSVSESTISAINTCQNWNWLHNYKNNIRKESNPEDYCSKEIILNIIKSLEIEPLTKTLKEIAKKHNVAESFIYNINSCKIWKNLHNYSKNIRKESHNIKHDVRCGENNSFSIYSEENILKTIELLEKTKIPYKEIEKQTGVKGSTITAINCCRQWKHLHNYKNNIRKESKLNK